MRFRFVQLAFLAALAVVIGCTQNREPPPVTHKAEGKVVLRDGKTFTTGGTITLYHETKSGVTTTGDIKSDGSFKLHSITADGKVPGAPEGEYSVEINPLSQDQNVQVIRLKKKQTIAAGDNDLKIVIGE